MKPAPNKPTRPATRWHGAKWRLAPWIIQHIPQDHDLFAVPFGGSAAVLLQKPRSLMEVYNDKDLEIYNFLLALRDKPGELMRAIQYTPFHLHEYELAFDNLDNKHELDPIERARQFYCRAYLSIMGPSVQWQNGFRRQKIYSRGASGNSSMKPAAISFSELEHLNDIATRLQGITFEKLDALDFMEMYDTERTCFYIDPPYLGETRSRQEPAYKHEMLSEKDHIRFLTLARGLQSMSLISGYKSELYAEHLEENGWTRYDKQSRTNGPGRRTESLWLNPQAQQKMETGQWQNPLPLT